MPFFFGDESFNSGDSTAIQCMIVKGDQPVEIRWTLNGNPVVTGENGLNVVRMSSRLSSLSIESIGSEHRGMFKCSASNAAGTEESWSELKVNGDS